MFANLSARKKLMGIVAIATLAMAAITMLANIGLYHSAENHQIDLRRSDGSYS